MKFECYELREYTQGKKNYYLSGVWHNQDLNEIRKQRVVEALGHILQCYVISKVYVGYDTNHKKRKVTLEEVIDKARQINEERASVKKKPLKWAENIVNGVTDGVQGDKIYEINKAVIDLTDPSCPMMTDEAKELIDSMMYAPMDTEGRSIENLYQIILKNDVDDLKDPTKFANFFTEFKYIIDKEQKKSEF